VGVSKLVREATENDPLKSVHTEFVSCNLTFGLPQQTKKDKRAQNNANQDNSAHGAYDVRRHLYAAHTLAPFKSTEAAARSFLRGRCTQVGQELWLNKHLALDTVQIIENEYFVERSQLKVKFAQDYVKVLRDAEQMQGRGFDATIYPDVSAVMSQFTQSFDMYPVGHTTASIFDDLAADNADDLAKRIRDTTMRDMASAVEDPLARLIRAVMNMHNKISRDGSRIYDSLLGELEEVTAFMPALNVGNVGYLNDMAEKCREQLTVASSEELRNKDSGGRQKVRDNAAGLLTAFGIDPDENTKITESGERKETAKEKAAEILSQMRGVF